MAELVTLTEDGPLGKAGTQVWVDEAPPAPSAPKPAKKTPAAKRTTTKKG